ncbi:zinc finger protein 37-like [Branchiostoma lanceolatum]|uniref:zinc finger protein 37-like n=1 Tax=Branchiostoma lanceolatum TaxID=7740 RepID=UPI003451FBD1
MSNPEIRACGLSKDVTLAVLPRLYLEELLIELSRRNISTEYSSREHLVTVLRDVIEYEYRTANPDAVQKAVEYGVTWGEQQRKRMPFPANPRTEMQQYANEANFPTAYAQTMSSIWSPPIPPTQYSSTSMENSANKTSREDYTNFSIFPTFTAVHKPASVGKTPSRQENAEANFNVKSKETSQTEIVLVRGPPSNDEDATWDPNESDVLEQLVPTTKSDTAVDSGTKPSQSNVETSTKLKESTSKDDTTSQDVTVAKKKPQESSLAGGKRRRPRKATPTKRGTKTKKKKLKIDEVWSGSEEDSDMTAVPKAVHKGSQDGCEGGGEEDVYHCPQCEYTSKVKVNMQHHIRTHTGEKPFKCSECDYSASQKVHLDTHMTRHTGERSYMCEECGHRTAFRCNLVRHLRTHSGEKPYKCELCSYRAIRRTHLTNHMRTHTGEKPFMCEECGHMTTDKTSLIRHKRNHTNDKYHM